MFLGKKIAGFYAKGLCEPPNIPQTDISLPSLDSTNVRAVKACLSSKFLLRPVPGLTQLPHLGSKLV